MSRGSLPGRPRCDTTTPRPRPLRRRRQRPCFRRPSRGPPRVPGPGPGSGLPRLVREGSSARSRAGFGGSTQARRAGAQGYERDADPICPGPATPCDGPTGRTDPALPRCPHADGAKPPRRRDGPLVGPPPHADGSKAGAVTGSPAARCQRKDRPALPSHDDRSTSLSEGRPTALRGMAQTASQRPRPLSRLVV